MNKKTLLLFGISFLLLIATIRGDVGNYDTLPQLYQGVGNPAFESPHERSSFVLLFSMLNQHSMSLSRELADFGFNDVGYHNDKLYSLFPPGVVLMIAPLYLLGSLVGLGQFMAYLTVIIVALGAMYLIFLIARNVFKLSEWVAGVAAFVFIFGTTSWSYSITIYQHIFTICILLASFYAAYLFQKEKHLQWGILAVILYILSVAFDYTNMVLLSPILLYLFWTNKETKMRYILPFVAFVGACGIAALYNQVVFGDWKVLSNSLPVYKLTPHETLEHIDSVSQSLGRFHLSSFVRGVGTLLFSFYGGLFVYSPVLLLGCMGLRKIFKQKLFSHESLFFLGVIMINILLYSAFDDPRGGWSFGPRYLLPTMASLALFLGIWLEGKGKEYGKKVITYSLFSISGFIALLGALVTNMIPWTDPIYSVLRLPLGIAYAFSGLISGRAGSFFYHVFLESHLHAPAYFMCLFLLLITAFGLFLFSPQQKS